MIYPFLSYLSFNSLQTTSNLCPKNREQIKKSRNKNGFFKKPNKLNNEIYSVQKSSIIKMFF